MIEKDIFKNLKADYAKLIEYGFVEENGIYKYSKSILNDEYTFIFTLENDGGIKVDLIENAINEPLDLFYILNAKGKFIGEINEHCQTITNDIALKCFNRNVFKSDYSKKLIEYVRNKYGDELEFLWEKFSNNAIWRRKDNKKWYAIMVVIPKNKIDDISDEIIDALVIRADREQIPTLVDNKQIYKGYHMNKNSWITICLDGLVDFEKICNFLDESYILAKNNIK